MVTTLRWILRQLGKLALFPDYFRVLAKEWVNILFGETLVGIGFLFWWSLAGPSNAKLIVVFVLAMFVAGYYAWRADHIRLLPKLEVKDFTRQRTDTLDQKNRKNGWSEYLQLLPRCLTEENVEECRGLLTSIDMFDGFSNGWEQAEWEVMFLEWSHGDASPITLYPHAERRLNVFSMHSSNHEIRPCVVPYPVRFYTLFNQLPLRQIKAVRFNIRVIAKHWQSSSLPPWLDEEVYTHKIQPLLTGIANPAIMSALGVSVTYPSHIRNVVIYLPRLSSGKIDLKWQERLVERIMTAKEAEAAVDRIIEQAIALVEGEIAKQLIGTSFTT